MLFAATCWRGVWGTAETGHLTDEQRIHDNTSGEGKVTPTVLCGIDKEVTSYTFFPSTVAGEPFK